MEKTKNGITEGVIWKQLLLFFFPILIGTFFQQLYNTVDTIIVGQFVGTEALAAVGTTGTVINLLVGFFVGVASGATVIISQYFGANDRENLSKSVHTSMALAVAGGVVIMVFGIVTARPTMLAMGVPDDIMDDAVLYMNVYYLGIIGNLIYNIGTGVLRAIGDSRMPLYVLIVCCLANVVLDLLFVVVFHWGVFGVAFATILSQLISAVLLMIRLMGTQEAYRVELRKIRFHKDILKNVVRIGLPAGLQSVMYSFSNILIQASINSFGTTAIAAWAAIGKIDGFIWMVMNAFGIAVTTFAGQNFGARQYDRVRRGTMTCLAMTAGTTLCISLALYPSAQLLFRLFSSDDAVVAQGVQMMHYLVPVYMTYICIEIFSGALRGCGDVRVPTIITVFAVCIMRIVWLAVALPFKHEISVVEFSYPLTWITATVLFAIYYAKGGWMQRCIAAQNAKTQG